MKCYLWSTLFSLKNTVWSFSWIQINKALNIINIWNNTENIVTKTLMRPNVMRKSHTKSEVLGSTLKDKYKFLAFGKDMKECIWTCRIWFFCTYFTLLLLWLGYSAFAVYSFAQFGESDVKNLFIDFEVWLCLFKKNVFLRLWYTIYDFRFFFIIVYKNDVSLHLICSPSIISWLWNFVSGILIVGIYSFLNISL